MWHLKPKKTAQLCGADQVVSAWNLLPDWFSAFVLHLVLITGSQCVEAMVFHMTTTVSSIELLVFKRFIFLPYMKAFAVETEKR